MGDGNTVCTSCPDNPGSGTFGTTTADHDSPDGSPSDMGAYGGSGAKGWNLDGDGFFEWWQVGEYDSAYVKRDCDDLNPTVNPHSGC